MLRKNNIKVETDLFKRKLKKILSYADSKKIKHVILVGKDLDDDTITIKDMETGNQEIVPLNDLIDYMNELYE
jgi:histidyl-tRNA synthetase